MSRGLPPQLVIVTRDPGRRLALVTGGDAAARAAVLVARDARWSDSGRGWVIADPEDALNLRGYAQLHGLWLRERELPP